MKYLYTLILLIVLLLSCETTTDPIIYDKDIEVINKEAELIQILISNKNFQEAEKQIEKNLILFPNNIDIMVLKGWLLLEQKNIEESEKLFLLLLEKKRKNPLVLTGLARINRIKGNREKALEYIDEGLSYLSTNSYLWLEKGIIEYESKEYKKALINFNKSYSLYNNNNDAYFFKYITMLHTGRELDEVKQYWETLLKKRTLQSWYFQYHADFLYNKNMKENAVQILETGLENFPNDPYLLNMLSYYLFNEYKLKNDVNTLENAKKNIIKCIENNDKIKPEFLDTYFLVLKESDEKEKLNNEIKKYSLIFPDSEIIIEWIRKISKK